MSEKTDFNYIKADNMIPNRNTFFERREYYIWILIDGRGGCKEIVMLWLLWTQFLVSGIPLFQAESSVWSLRKINVSASMSQGCAITYRFGCSRRSCLGILDLGDAE